MTQDQHDRAMAAIPAQRERMRAAKHVARVEETRVLALTRVKRCPISTEPDAELQGLLDELAALVTSESPATTTPKEGDSP